MTTNYLLNYFWTHSQFTLLPQLNLKYTGAIGMKLITSLNASDILNPDISWITSRQVNNVFIWVSELLKTLWGKEKQFFWLRCCSLWRLVQVFPQLQCVFECFQTVVEQHFVINFRVAPWDNKEMIILDVERLSWRNDGGCSHVSFLIRLAFTSGSAHSAVTVREARQRLMLHYSYIKLN